RRLRQSHYVVFTEQIEIAVRVGDRALADAAVAPEQLPCLKVESRQDGVVEPVDGAVHEDDAAMMVLHVSREIDLLGFHFPSLNGKSQQGRSGVIPRS